MFCRTDGTSLVSDSLPFPSEAGTARLGSAPTEIETSILPHATDGNVSRSTGPTTVLPSPTSSTGTRELTKPKRGWVAIAFVALIAATVCIAGYFYFTRRTQSTIQSIAVMPFVNESGNADIEYLSDGMTEITFPPCWCDHNPSNDLRLAGRVAPTFKLAYARTL